MSEGDAGDCLKQAGEREASRYGEFPRHVVPTERVEPVPDAKKDSE